MGKEDGYAEAWISHLALPCAGSQHEKVQSINSGHDIRHHTCFELRLFCLEINYKMIKF